MDKDERIGKLIGYCLNPKVEDYYKVIQVVGDERLDGLILPDAKLLVRISDFMRGSFVGIEVRKDVSLRKKYVLMRDGKEVSAFSLQRVPFDKPGEGKDFNVSQLKSLVGGEGWQPIKRKGLDFKKEVRNAEIRKNPLPVKPKKEVRSKEAKTKPPLSLEVNANGDVMYEEREGDLFSVTSGLIINTISADVEMSAGIAESFVRRYPEDKNIMLGLRLRVGNVYLSNDDNLVRRGYLITKKVYGSKPTMNTMRMALRTLKQDCIAMKIGEVNMPLIGCGIDRMNWDEVKEVVKEILVRSNIRVRVWVYDVKKEDTTTDGADDKVKDGDVNKEVAKVVSEVPVLLPTFSNYESLKWFGFDSLEKRTIDDMLLAEFRVNTYIDITEMDIIGFRDVDEVKDPVDDGEGKEWNVVYIWHVNDSSACACLLRDVIKCEHSVTVIDFDGEQFRAGVAYAE